MSTPQRGDSALVRGIGVFGLAAGIVNIAVGGGIFKLPASVAGSLGRGAPFAYLVCALVMGLVVLCFAAAGSRVALTGGPYAYVEVAFGPFVGFLAGVLLWLLGTFAAAAVAAVFVSNATALSPALHDRGPLVLVVVMGGLAALNVVGLRSGTLLNTVTATAKLVPLLVLLVAGAWAARHLPVPWPAVPPAGDLARTSALLVFAFCGFECALVPSGEVRDVARTVPRAILLAMGAVCLLYLGLQFVAQAVMGDRLAAAVETPLADLGFAVLGRPGRLLLLGGATLSMFGFLSGMTLAVPRALFAFARDGFLPGFLASVHPRYRTPAAAIAVQTAIVTALALTSSFERLAILANLSILLVYAVCCLAAFELRRRNVQAGGTPFEVPGAAVVPFAACAGIVWILFGMKRDEWIAVFLAILGASLLFGLSRLLRGSARAAAAPGSGA
jgi:amino acid transporter